MLVRDEFYAEREKKREKIYDFCIAFGGTDTLNLSQKRHSRYFTKTQNLNSPSSRQAQMKI